MDGLSSEERLASIGASVTTFSPPAQRGRTVGKLRLLSVLDTLALPPRTYLVPGLLAPGETSVWWGAPKCGKTFLVMRLAFGLALGRGMWGREPWRPLRVLYAAAEGEGGIATRLRALLEELGDPGDRFTLIAQRMTLGPPSDHLDDLIAATRLHRADLVIVDTLARTFGDGDEDRAQDMGAFVEAMDRLREEGRMHGAPMPHVAIIHHGAKDAGAKTPRGSGALLGAADLVVRVRKGEEDAPSLATVEYAKDDADGIELPFKLRIVGLDDGTPDGRRTCLAEEADSFSTRRRSLPEAKAAWLNDLQEAFAEPGMAELRSPKLGMAATHTLTREQIRSYYRVRMRLDAEPHATLTSKQRGSLRDNLNWLSDHGFIGMTETLVWLL